MKLAPSLFRTIIEHTPLISIDLLIRNEKNEILLGWRQNAPAKNSWFAPGGRIRKDEAIEQAFKRISRAETGMEFDLQTAEFAGIYEHLYPGENFFGIDSFGSHYIVLAFNIQANLSIDDLPDDQHNRYKWFTVDEILNDPDVHLNTKNYFNGTKAIK